jgi:DNA polymerase III subunit beta
MIVQVSHLKALLRFAAVKDARYYLVGVYFDPRGYMVTTDGHTLLATRIEAFPGEGFIIPSATVKAAITLNKKAIEIDVTPAVINGIGYTPVDGRFPDWQHIVPAKLSGKTVTFNPDYLARVKAAANDMGIKCEALAIGYNGEAPAVIALPQADALAIVLPVRAGKGQPINQGAFAIAFVKPAVAATNEELLK